MTTNSWWVSLMSDHELQLRVFARLPFVTRDGEEVRALALGQLEIEPSGDDLTPLAIEAEQGLSRGRAARAANDGEFEARMGRDLAARPAGTGGPSGRGRQLRRGR